MTLNRPIVKVTRRAGARPSLQSQEQLAVASGLHWIFAVQVDRGCRNLSPHNILRLAAGLDIDPAKLMKGLSRP